MSELKNISKAIIEVMKSVKGMEKKSVVGAGKNSYNGTKDQDVKEVFNKGLAKNGLCILPIDIEETTQVDRWEAVDPWSKETPKLNKMYQSVFTKVKTKYLLLHTSGESIELTGCGHGIDPQDKSAGKATTYALKNCLLYTFLTPVGKIDDTENTHSDNMETPEQGKTKEWLTEKFLKGILVLQDAKEVKKYLDHYSTDTHGMKKDYRDQLNKRINELKK